MGMKKPKRISDKSLASSTSRSSDVETKKSPPPNNSLLSVLRPKVYIIDSSSFKKLVQELTGKGPLKSSSPSLPSPSSSLSSSPPPLPSIITGEDIPTLSEDNSSSQVLPEMSPDANSIMSSPYDMDYVPFPSTIHKGFTFSYDDIESWLMEMEPVASISTRHEMEPVDVSVYDYDFS